MFNYYLMFILQFLNVCTTIKKDVRTVLNKVGKSFKESLAITGRNISIHECMM